MPKKKKKFSLLGAFSKIGGGVVKTGEAAKRLGSAVKMKPTEKGDEVSKRLAEIKRLETLREEDLREERKLMEEEEAWGGRAERQGSLLPPANSRSPAKGVRNGPRQPASSAQSG